MSISDGALEGAPCTCVATGARFWVKCLCGAVPDFLRPEVPEGPCSACDEAGFVEVDCQYCHGTGRLPPPQPPLMCGGVIYSP